MVSAQYSLALPLTQLGPYLSLSPTVPTVWETAAVAWLPCLSESKFNSQSLVSALISSPKKEIS